MKKRFLQIPIVLFLTIQSLFGQIAGPCGTTITTTNATNPAATDGTITIKGLTGSNYYIRMGITGSEMYFEMLNTSATDKKILTGLAAGTYNIIVGRNGVCGGTQSIVVGSNSYASCSGTEIGGIIYHDANANGVREAAEGGAGNVTIKAYNSAGTLVNTQTSAATGVFKFTGLTSGQPYRLEYSWADSYLQPGAVGSGSGTSVQFVNSGACTANMGINYPGNYCQTTNPYVITPCYINGNPQAPAVSTHDVMVTFPYKTANHDWDIAGQNAPPTHVASANQMGATWSVAYQKTTKYAFAGAVMRRFAGFGPLGTGGIYKINMTTPATPSVSNWIDLKTIGINTGNDTRNATPANTLSTAPGTPTWDAEAFNQVGKVGIGGMDFNERGDTLWLINLADRKLYGIKNVNPSVTPTAANIVGGYSVVLPAGYTCATNANDFRPWAVKYYKGLVYIGAVCSGESTPWTPANLRGFVLSFDPANTAAGFSYVTDFPLNYAHPGWSTSTFQFQPWFSNTTSQSYVTQPMVTDLEFDVDGSLILAVGDRGGFQSGNQNYLPDPTATNTTLIEGNTYGDVLRFCKTGSTFTQSGVVSCPNPTVNPFTYSEFYWGEHGPVTGSSNAFNEVGAGSIAFSAGNNSILMTGQDAYAWYSGGIFALSNTSGGDLYRYVIYDSGSPGASGKATGLGDLEMLCDPAPIEIGNRVWEDTDRDGIQDANEVGLAGIQIELYQGATLIATTTSDASGNYKFTSLLPNTAYQIRVSLGQATLGSRVLSTTDVGSNGSDLIDSDMSKSGSNGIINLTSGNYGENNHTFDIGFEPNCNATVTATGSNNCEGATATLSANGSSGGTYSWSGPNGFTSTLQNPTITNAQLIHTGAYTVTFTKSNGCTATGSAQLNVFPKPVLVATGDNECVWANIDLNVTATGGSGFTYSWSGPSGFTSSSQNPIRTAATAAMAGTYTVTVTNSDNCSTTATVTVVVNTGCTYQCCPTGNLLTNGNFETEGGTNFNTSFEGVPAIYLPSNNVSGVGPYNWIRGFGEPDDPTNFIGGWYLKKTGAAGEPYEGSHYIYLRGKNANGSVCYGNPVTVLPCKKYKICAKAAAWTPTSVGVQGAADVDFIFYYTDASNTIKVVFYNFTIPANTSGSFNDLNWAEYSWTFDVPSDYNGNGRIYVSSYDNVDGVAFDDVCFSIASNVLPPTITATGDTKCEGGTINLTASGGTLYAWSGPNGFTSNLQNPTIANATLAMAGTYTVTVTGATYCTSTTTVNVVVNPMTAISVQPTGFSECVGGNLNLSVTASGVGVTYQWQSSPDNATWTNIVGATASTYLPPSVSSGSVWYRLLVGSSSCAVVNSNSAQVTVVNDPSVSVTLPPAIVCVGANITLTASPTVGTGTCSVQWQSSPDGTTWTNISGATGTTYNVVNLGATTRYRARLVSCSGNGCCN